MAPTISNLQPGNGSLITRALPTYAADVAGNPAGLNEVTFPDLFTASDGSVQDQEGVTTTRTLCQPYAILGSAPLSDTYTYDALGNRTFQTDAEQTVTRYQYDDLNRLRFTTLNYKSGGPTNFETNVTTEVIYDRLGRTAERIDGRDNSTVYEYDDLGRTRFVTDANGNTTETIYDGLGNRRFIINAEEEQTEFRYDGVNRLVTVIDDLSNATDYVYNKAGERTAMIDAETVETRYEYDALGRLTDVIENYDDGTFSLTITDQDVRTQYGYDRVGNRTVITNARSYTTTYRYDALNRRTHTIDALGNTTRYGYDRVGNREVITDANDVVTTFRYDDVYRLTDILYGDSTPDVTFTYDDVGNRETMTDGTGQTVYGYDELYRLDSVNDGAGLQVAYQYDEAGNRTRLTYPLEHGGVVTYTYDAANRLDTVTDWRNGQFGYNYDDANRITGLSLPNGITSTYGYDDAGRLTLLTHQLPITNNQLLASYAYDLDGVGNRRVLTESLVTVQNLPAGAYLESNGLVVLEAENGDITNGLTHTWLRLTALTGYTGTSYVQTAPDIDALYQTSEITASPVVSYPINFTTPGTYTLWLRGYPANAAGDSAYVNFADQTVSVTGFAPGEWSWAEATTPISVTTGGVYSLNLWMREDGLRIDRLLLTTDTTFIPTDFGPPETERQLGGGSFITPLTRTIVYTYDNLYRLTEADYTSGENYQYSYDPVGNRLQQIIDGDTTAYLYDAANRLEFLNGQQVYTFDDNGNLLNSDTLTNTWDAANRLIETERDGATIEPIYNGVNDRVGQTVGVSTTNYALDVAAGLPEVIYTTEGNAYLHLPGVIMAESAEGEVRYLLSDGLGSVRQAVDESGALVASHEFDPYGNPVQGGGEPYGYTGEWWESDVNLLHLRARWYSAGTGTFLSRDLWEGNPNRPISYNPWLYGYANPVRWNDKSGLSPEVSCENMPDYLLLRNLCWIGNGDDNDPVVLDARERIFRTMVILGSLYGGVFNEGFLWGSRMLEHFLDGNGTPMSIEFSEYNDFFNDPGITRATREERPPRFTTDEPQHIRPLLYEFVDKHIRPAVGTGTQFSVSSGTIYGENLYDPPDKRPRPYSTGFWAAFGHVAIDGTFSADVRQSCTYEGYFVEYTANYRANDRYEWFEGKQTPFDFPNAPGVVWIPHEWEISLMNATPPRAHEYSFTITGNETKRIFVSDDFNHIRELAWWEWESQYGRP